VPDPAVEVVLRSPIVGSFYRVSATLDLCGPLPGLGRRDPCPVEVYRGDRHLGAQASTGLSISSDQTVHKCRDGADPREAVREEIDPKSDAGRACMRQQNQIGPYRLAS